MRTLIIASVLAGTFNLSVQITQTPTPEVLRERCDGREACTRFVGEQLIADCVARNDAWVIDASATSVALLYGIKSSRVTHETLHVEDMRVNVRRHLQTLQAKKFPTADACREAAGIATAAFSATMKRFAAESMSRRH